jgi:hypothetical protein
VGGLEERFYPAYYVDVDLSMALRQRGFSVLYQPKSRIKHHRGASSSARFRTFVSARNRRLFLSKWSAALELYDPPDPDSEIAIAKALNRAENFAASPQERDIFSKYAISEFDREKQQRAHLEMALALNIAFNEHLIGLIEAAETERDGWKATAEKALAKSQRKPNARPITSRRVYTKLAHWRAKLKSILTNPAGR